MTITAACFIGYIAQTIALSFGLVTTRVTAQLTQGRLANSFAADGTDLGPFGQRMTRAFGNSLEWLAIPAALMLFALATGQTAITDTLAPFALAGRIAQSTTHLISTSPGAVQVRGAFLGVQVVVWVVWAFSFATTVA